MRRFHLYTILKAALLLTCIAGLTPAVAQNATESAPPAQIPPGQATTLPPQDLTSSARLNRLYESLKRQRDTAKAKGIANQIRREWADSGSATVNLLMKSASDAAGKKQNATALDFLDRVTILQPDYAEAWHRRATLHYAMNNSRKAMSDLNEALKINPQQFDALAALGGILATTGRDKLALEVLERYLAIYPADKDAQKRMLELSDKLAGDRS